MIDQTIFISSMLGSIAGTSIVGVFLSAYAAKKVKEKMQNPMEAMF